MQYHSLADEIYSLFEDDEDDDLPAVTGEMLNDAIVEVLLWGTIPLLECAPPDPASASDALRFLDDELFNEDWRGGGTPDPLFRQIIGEAIDLLRSGLSDEALARLNLVIKPRYHHVSECDAAYMQAMARAYGPHFPAEPWKRLPLFN